MGLGDPTSRSRPDWDSTVEFSASASHDGYFGATVFYYQEDEDLVMAEKQKPVGVCDLCGREIARADWYTSKGRPRLHCSLECKQTANSRAGNPKRVAKTKARIAAGQWQNPHHLNPPTSTEQARRARLGRQREVAAGTTPQIWPT